MGLISLLFQEPLLFVIIVVTLIFTLTIHEFAHAYTGFRLGDPTAERMGRLTLNPLAHIDPMGFLMLLIAGFGYAKPVPFNPYLLPDARIGSVLIAVAGPISNFILGTICAVAYGFLAPQLGSENLLVVVLFFLGSINFTLMLFNLIPIPPLDGSKVLLAVLAAPQYRNIHDFLETRGPMLLLGLIIMDIILGIGVFTWIFTGSRALFGLFVGG